MSDIYAGSIPGLSTAGPVGDIDQSILVELVTSDTGTSGTDFNSLGTIVTIAAGEATAIAEVEPLADTTSGPADSTSPMVVDDDIQLVTVTKIADAFEGGANGIVRFTRTGDTTASLTVNYTVTGTAVGGTDYTSLSGSVSFAADVATADVAVTLSTDSSAESTETVIVTVTSGSTYGADPHAIDVVNVVDDDTNSGVIGGSVWLDADEDGIQDSGEDEAEGYSVALLDADDNRLFNTLTNSSGVYSFRGLPEGEYFVHVQPQMGWNFTAPDQGGSDSVDSDVDDNGWTNAISLVSTAMSKTNVGAGFFMIAAPVAENLTVIITKANGDVLAANGPLKVAKWGGTSNNAWASVFKAKPEDPSVPVLSGPDANWNDFIDRDDDRFNIRVKDAGAWVANTLFIEATLGTLHADGTTVNDDATTISLTRITAAGWAGWYWSDSQILVSTEADDKHQDRNVRRDDADPSFWAGWNYKAGRFFEVSDRTHRIGIEGKVSIVYAGEPAVTATVPIEKTVKLHVTILRNMSEATGGTPAIDPAVVNYDIAVMREIYAQAGIRVLIVDDTGATINAVGVGQVKDPPPGVTLDGGSLDEFPGELIHTVLFGDKIAMTAEEQALLGHAAYRTPTVGGKDDVEVYYVNKLSDGSRGEAFPRGYLFGSSYQHSVVVAKDKRNFRTLAHEVGHILTDESGHTGDPNPTAVDRTNLMVTGEFSITSYSIIDSRRLTADQANSLRTTVAALLQ